MTLTEIYNNILILEDKIRNYLLSEEHLLGRYKAQFFKQHGFDLLNWKLLRGVILEIAENNEILEIIPSAFGDKFVITGYITTPKTGRKGLKTIWINLLGTNDAIFITAYPI